MKIDRLPLFLGKPITFNGAEVISPTVEKVAEMGEIEYGIKCLLSTFNKEKILVNLFGVSEDDMDEIIEEDDYIVLTDNLEVTRYISDAISLFVYGSVYYNFKLKSFSFLSLDKEVLIENFINFENYKKFAQLINILNGISYEEVEIPKFKNERAKKMYRELEKLRKKNKKHNNDGLELKDILSLLCSEGDNGINIFNIHLLTIYQVYEQFERIGIRNTRDTILPVWANGHLKEGDSLPDVFIRTKL